MNRNKSHFEGDEPFLENLLRWFRYIKIIPYIKNGSNVLDLGCGYNAGLLSFIKKNECNYFGIDLSVNKNIANLIEHDLNTTLPFKDKTFDVVMSLANLEHLNNPEFNIKEIGRVLKDDGIVLLTTPSTYSKPILEFLSFKLHLISVDEIRDHKNYFNKSILVKIFKSNGFKNVKHRYFQFFMNNFIIANK